MLERPLLGGSGRISVSNRSRARECLFRLNRSLGGCVKISVASRKWVLLCHPMRSWFRYMNCLAMLLAWVVFANHCFITEALALPAPESNKSHHCHGHEEESSKSKQDPKGAHPGCKDEGCCQPALQSSSVSADAVFSYTAFVPAILTHFVINSYLAPLAEPLPLLEGTGPPGTKDNLISTLCQAPNAPPFP